MAAVDEFVDVELLKAREDIRQQVEQQNPEIDPSSWQDAKILQSQTRLAFFLVVVAHFEPLLLEHVHAKADGKRYLADVWKPLQAHSRRNEIDLDRLQAIFEVRNRLLHAGFIWTDEIEKAARSLEGLEKAAYDSEWIEVGDNFVRMIATELADTYGILAEPEGKGAARSPIEPSSMVARLPKP